MEFSTFCLLLSILIFLMLYIGRSGCGKEKYADQVIHGTVGGIAGPIIDDSFFVPSVPKNVPMLMKKWRDVYPETVSI